VDEEEPISNAVLPIMLPNLRSKTDLVHKQVFYETLQTVPCEIKHVSHQSSHIASAFWGSDFHEAHGLTYDGGMLNETDFGGLYFCNAKSGITQTHKFDALIYAKVTTLYTFVTALLGFSPMKHEGKITGLSAYGSPNAECDRILQRWLTEDYKALEETLLWINEYDREHLPVLYPNTPGLAKFKSEIASISKEDLAYAVQRYTEQHVLDILDNVDLNKSKNICLAGGLFANVKLNQRVYEKGFEKIFIAPAMTDDGTALGAALHVAAQKYQFQQFRTTDYFLGLEQSKSRIEEYLKEQGIRYECTPDDDGKIAEYLSKNQTVAIFQGRMEFGPRALGNRSILASTTDPKVNISLNEKLNRTEFMPFAPMTLVEFAGECYLNIDKVLHAAEFMTITFDCTDFMKEKSPAAVHIDGTARPQIVTKAANPTIHNILSTYQKLTGIPSIINTSFNVHEEPITCTIEDALNGFLLSGLDYLYLPEIGIVSRVDNSSNRIAALERGLKGKTKLREKSIINGLQDRYFMLLESNRQLASDLIERTHALEASNAELIERTRRLEFAEPKVAELESVIEEKNHYIQLLKQSQPVDS